MLTTYSGGSLKRFFHRCKLPYFTIRGWIMIVAAGTLGGVIGNVLFSMAVSQLSK